MFTTTPSAPPTLSTTTVTSPASPTSAGRSRLRGLSYLHRYAQNLHVRSDSDSSNRASRPSLPRTQSQPSPTEETQQGAAGASAQTRRTPSPPNASTSSGWLPASSARGRHGSSRATIRQQSTSSEAPSSEPAPTITTTTAETAPTIPRPMTRSRADTAAPVLSVRSNAGPRSTSADGTNDGVNGQSSLPSIRLIPHFDPRANRPSLSFPAITRTLPSESSIIRVGRYSERENAPEIPPNLPSSAPVGFKSKVVSRRHCEFWCQNNQWFVKDVKSSSGTFLNHLRLSPPGVESRAYPVNDGDVVQLGIDFRGGEEMIFRCVKIRIECNRGWQKALNNFNKKTHKQLRNLAKPKKDSDAASVNSSECSICLMAIAPCQSLFVAPCSHVWHYKCIRPILNGHTWPNFLCPNCRAVADLEADVEEQEVEEWEEDSLEAVIEATRRDSVPKNENQPAPHAAPHLDVQDEPDGVRTPRAMTPLQESSARARADMDLHDQDPADISPDETDMTALAHDMSTNLDLHSHSREISPLSSPEPDDNPDIHLNPPPASEPQHSGNENSGSAPRPIPTRQANSYELSPGTSGVSEGPMTPRNDAGPFVLDGGAGRLAGTGSRRSARNEAGVAERGVPASLDQAASEVGLGPI